MVWTLFQKHTRKFRRRPSKKVKKKTTVFTVESRLKELLVIYKSPGFVHRLRTFIMSLPTGMMTRITALADELLIGQTLPKHIPLIVKDLAKYRLNKHCRDSAGSAKKQSTRGYLKLEYHNKGIEMVNLPQILNSKPVTVTIPSFLLSHKESPIVSYSYTNTIGPKKFNFKQCMKNLYLDVGTNDMSCNCGNFIYMDRG